MHINVSKEYNWIVKLEQFKIILKLHANQFYQHLQTQLDQNLIQNLSQWPTSNNTASCGDVHHYNLAMLWALLH
jgi:hypothetical protein